MNETDEGRFVLMSQYIRKSINAYRKKNPNIDRLALIESQSATTAPNPEHRRRPSNKGAKSGN